MVLIVGGFCSLVWLRLGWGLDFVCLGFMFGLVLGFGWCGSGC